MSPGIRTFRELDVVIDNDDIYHSDDDKLDFENDLLCCWCNEEPLACVLWDWKGKPNNTCLSCLEHVGDVCPLCGDYLTSECFDEDSGFCVFCCGDTLIR